MTRISVIIPYYKGKEYIAEAIRSVQDQSESDWELIFVDDGSPDDGRLIVERLASRDRRINVVRQRNAGVSSARNAGAALADSRSRYLLFLDQDDVLEANALGVMALYLEQHQEVGAAYFAASTIDCRGNLVQQAVPAFRCTPGPRGWRQLAPGHAETPLVSLMAAHHAVPSTTIFRRCVFQRTGGWDESFQHAFEDQDLVWRAALVAPVHYVPIPVVRKRDHASNASKQPLLRGHRQLRHKWWRGAHLPPELRPVVREVMTRETLLTARLNLHAARQSLARGLSPCGLRLAYSGARKLGLFLWQAAVARRRGRALTGLGL